jgi:hypothetical protein
VAEFRALTTAKTRLLRSEHPDTLYVHQKYAVGMYHRGRYREAEAELAELVGRYAAVFGAEDESTAGVQGWLDAARQQG